MRKISLFIIVCVVVSFAAETSFYTNTNRLLFVSPTYTALGGSNVLTSSEPLPVTNPASIIGTKRKDLFVGFNNYFKNSHNSTVLSGVVPLSEKQNVALSVGYLYVPVDSVSASLDQNGIPYDYVIKTKTSSELYINAYYAHTLLTYSKGALTVGGSVHFNRRRLIDWSGYGIGLDIGVVNAFTNGVTLGLHINDVTTQFMHWSSDYKELGKPICFAAFAFETGSKHELALSYKTPDLFGNSGLGRTDKGSTIFDEEVGYISVKSDPLKLLSHASYGVAGTFNKRLILRAGFSDARKLSFGGGVKLFERLGIDFAYARQSDLGGTYTVSSTYSL